MNQRRQSNKAALAMSFVHSVTSLPAVTDLLITSETAGLVPDTTGEHVSQ